MAEFTVVPPATSLGPGETAEFSVSEAPSGTVTWSLDPHSGAGSLDSTGKYTAPAIIDQPTEVTITAQVGEAVAITKVSLRPSADAQKAVSAGETAAADTQKPASGEKSTPGENAVAAGGEQQTGAGASARDSGAGSAAPASVSITIEPALVVLAERSAHKFVARDAQGQEVAATWSLVGAEGLGPDVIGTLDRATGAYTAPAQIPVDRHLTIVATTVSGAADKAFIVLTSALVTITPGEITLRGKEQQYFQARVQGDPKNEVTWLTAPRIGRLEANPPSTAMLYTAPDTIDEDAQIIVAAISKASNEVGHARILLLADPWVGSGPRRIGVWLLGLAIVVPVLYFIWPPPVDRSKIRTATTARQESARIEGQRNAAVMGTNQNIDALNRTAALPENAEPQRRADLAAQVQALRAALAVETVSLQDAQRDRQAKEDAEAAEKQAYEDGLRDERVLFVLVLLAGMLGSFVHTTRSFVDFIGNRRLRPSWTWWYTLQPFTGAALAMVVYLVVRGGFLAGAPAGTSLNPWGFVAVASLVGLFSKQATNKLDEIFSTMFRTDKERELKDKLEAPKKQP